MASLKQLEKDFAKSLASREKELFLDTLLAHTDLSLVQLASLAKSQCRELADQTTIEDLLRYATPGSRREKTAVSRHGAVSTRTAADRRDFDAQVLAFVTACTEPCTATEVRESLGGTPLQVRRALNRLIERGDLTYLGQARGTRYSAN